jgi:hypothetical protein
MGEYFPYTDSRFFMLHGLRKKTQKFPSHQKQLSEELIIPANTIPLSEVVAKSLLATYIKDWLV